MFFSADDVRRAERGEKLIADDVAAITPLDEYVIGPQNCQLAVEQGHRIGHTFQDAVVFKQATELHGVL